MSYEQFIREAFIDPIRSVLIVDDDYPTYDDVLGQREESYRAVPSEKSWTQNPSSIHEQIRKFRGRPRPLLVDIHDGTNVTGDGETKIASYLHQTDLLILDYELDKSRKEDGSQAISILRSLTRNNHLNLVVVYTNLDLDEAFDSVRIGMLGPSKDGVAQEERITAQCLIDDGEERVDGFTKNLRESVGMEQYLHSRQDENYLRRMAKGLEPFRRFVDLCADFCNHHERKTVLRYILEQFEREQQTQLNEETPPGLDWSSSSSIRWVRTNSVFIAFSRKTGADDLLSVLSESLGNWEPDPSTLFLTKIRASMDEYGVVNQADVLKQRHAFSLWYENLLIAEDTEREALIAESVLRHSDRLMETILPHVTRFAEKLIDDESADSPIGTVGKRFGVNLAKEEERRQATLSHNAFVCSKPPGGWHLFTGDVFVMKEDFWICLSPACDMVPSQISRTRVKELGNRLPFMAVRLTPMPDGKLPKDLNSGRYVFLRIRDAVKVFSFNPHSASSAPDWRILYAENRGKFFGDDFQFTVIRIEDDGKGTVSGVLCDAQVVAQLRYEYALNLVHKLSGFLTRIGLNFSDGRDRKQ